MNGNIMISDLLISTESKKGFMAARDTNTFAWRLRVERDKTGMSQFDMCDRIKEIVRQKEPAFDLSYPAYNKYETGDTVTPPMRVMAAISKVLGRSLDYLILGEEPDGEAKFATEEAEQVAAIVDNLPPELRAALLDGALLLQQLHRNIENSRIEHAMFLEEIKTLLPEQKRIQAQSILNKINHRRGE